MLLVLFSAALSVSANVGIRPNQSSGGAIDVSKTFPPDMAGDVSVNTPLTVEFGGAVTPAFYQSLNFNLFSGTQPIDGELFYNPAAQQIMFKPNGSLEENKAYIARISFHDGMGRTSEKAWSFKTGGGQTGTMQSAGVTQAVTTPGGSILIANTNLASGLPQEDSPIEITFSEALDIASLRDAPVKLLAGKTAIGIDYRLSRDMKTLTLLPRTLLSRGTDYSITMNGTLSGSSGRNLGKNTLIPFRVGRQGEALYVDVDPNIVNESPTPDYTATGYAPNPQNYDNPFSEDNQYRSQLVTQQPSPAVARVAQPAVQVTGIHPANNAAVTNLTQPVTVVFSNEIRPETLNEFTFRLEDDFGPVPARVHYFQGRKQATLTPIGMLDSERSYRVVVTQGVTDVTGAPIKTGISSTFHTRSPINSPAIPEAFAAGPVNQTSRQATSRSPENETRELEIFDDETPMLESSYNQPQISSGIARPQPQRQNPPQKVRRTVQTKEKLSNFRVVGILPGANSDRVSRETPILVNFNEPVNPSTINPINISVFGNQRRVEGQVKYDSNLNRAVFTPSRPLDVSTRYKVIVSDKIRSRSGEPLASAHTWEFATTPEARKVYRPKKTMEADAAFYIPLVDGRTLPKSVAGKSTTANAAGNGQAFSFMPENHWTFKSLRHIVKKGILPSFPFTFTTSVTRYEFANTINNALGNLKSMQRMSDGPKLRIADLIELQYLVIEFRSELKSFGVNTGWFESFLMRQGIRIEDLEREVSRKHAG